MAFVLFPPSVNHVSPRPRAQRVFLVAPSEVDIIDLSEEFARAPACGTFRDLLMSAAHLIIDIDKRWHLVRTLYHTHDTPPSPLM